MLAAIQRVQVDVVRLLEVHAFNDIDLTALERSEHGIGLRFSSSTHARPDGTVCGPESRPDC